jgi:tetratricopeptide (TPR) repeat protein
MAGFLERLRDSPRLQVAVLIAAVLGALAIGSLIESVPSQSFDQERGVVGDWLQSLNSSQFRKNSNSAAELLATANTQLRYAADSNEKESDYFGRAWAQHLMHRDDLALRDYTAALSIKGISKSVCAEDFLMRGQIRLQTGDARGAEQDFTQVLSLHSGDEWQAQIMRAKAWISLDEPNKALGDFNDAINKLPELRSQAYKEIPPSWEVSGADREKFVALIDARFRKVIAFAYGSRAIAYRLLGQYDKSLADYDTAIKAAPFDPNQYAGRARTEFAAGRWGDGFRDYWTQVTLRFEPRRKS